MVAFCSRIYINDTYDSFIVQLRERKKAMVDERLGKKIQLYREKAGLSQEELATRLGVSVTSISNIERGANYPSFENFIKILNIIGASPNQVMFDLVDNAQISKASELWDHVKMLDSKKRNKLFRIVEVIIEDDLK